MRLAGRGGSGNRELFAHNSVDQEVQAVYKCQGLPLSDPLLPGRFYFLKISQSLKPQPSSRAKVLKHRSLRETVYTHTEELSRRPLFTLLHA